MDSRYNPMEVLVRPGHYILPIPYTTTTLYSLDIYREEVSTHQCKGYLWVGYRVVIGIGSR